MISHSMHVPFLQGGASTAIKDLVFNIFSTEQDRETKIEPSSKTWVLKTVFADSLFLIAYEAALFTVKHFGVSSFSTCSPELVSIYKSSVCESVWHCVG
ncbi:hypothetical protein Bca4012_020807 [Brassica carinata]